MKKHLFLVAALVASMAVSAEVLLTETFDYTVGDAIGTTANWTTTGDITSGEGRLVSDVSLSYSADEKEYILSGYEKSLKHNYASNKTGSANGTQYVSYRTFATVSSGAVYLTYIYKPDGNQSQSNGELLGLTSGTSNPSARPWTGKLASGTTDGSVFRFGLTRQSGNKDDVQWGTNSYSCESTILLVLKYDITNGSASLFINPTLGATEEPTPDLTATDGTARNDINAIMFRNQGASKSNYYAGGVRVSTTWAEAVAIKADLPALDAPVVGEASAIGVEEFTANWTAVANATGYIVKVYEGEEMIAEETVNGQASTSAIIFDLPYSTALTYTVTAVGDGLNYDNSEASSASETFSTSDPVTSLVFLPSDAQWSTTGLYTEGTYTSEKAYGYDFTEIYLQDRTQSGYTARAVLKGKSGIITLPVVSSVVNLKIYANAGTADTKIQVDQYDYSTKTWSQLGDQLSLQTTISEVSATISTSIAKLRIKNIDGSTKYIWKIETIPAPDDPTAIDEVNAGVKARKVFKDGQMLIERNGELYNMTGAKVL